MTGETIADVEVALCEWLNEFGETVTVTPINLVELLQQGSVLRIRRIGGGADGVNDHPVVSIQGYVLKDADKPRAWFALMAQVDQKFLDILSGAENGYADGVLLENPDRTSGPVELPYPNAAIAVAESIYRLTIRR